MSGSMSAPLQEDDAARAPARAADGGRGSAFALFRGTTFGPFLLSRFAAVTATQMVSVAIGWHVYERTGDALALGFTGLAQFATMALLAPVAGTVADRFDRRWVLAACHLAYLA